MCLDCAAHNRCQEKVHSTGDLDLAARLSGWEDLKVVLWFVFNFFDFFINFCHCSEGRWRTFSLQEARSTTWFSYNGMPQSRNESLWVWVVFKFQIKNHQHTIIRCEGNFVKICVVVRGWSALQPTVFIIYYHIAFWACKSPVGYFYLAQ